VCSLAAVPPVLDFCSQPDIGSPIIQPIAIDVVDLQLCRGIQQDSMHSEFLPDATTIYVGDGIPSVTTLEGMPRVLTDKAVILFVNQYKFVF
jgi:hypothetical protein